MCPADEVEPIYEPLLMAAAGAGDIKIVSLHAVAGIRVVRGLLINPLLVCLDPTASGYFEFDHAG
jgi:hypothetical protein